jgi:hypothetical protein
LACLTQAAACLAEGYFQCPSCGERFFHNLEFEGKWYMQCAAVTS